MPKTQPEPIRDQTSDRLLTPQNCAIALIDYQPEQYRTVTSSSATPSLPATTSTPRLAARSRRSTDHDRSSSSTRSTHTPPSS